MGLEVVFATPEMASTLFGCPVVHSVSTRDGAELIKFLTLQKYVRRTTEDVLILDRVGVIDSVLDRLRAREDSLRLSTRNGGMFSLFPLRSVGPRDVRARLAHGLKSTVDASSSSSSS